MMVTPREIDTLAADTGKVVGLRRQPGPPDRVGCSRSGAAAG